MPAENKHQNEAAAHVRQDEGGAWIDHSLAEHLQSVGALAGEFAAASRPSDAAWARLAGLWHDLGKYRPGFQTYIRQANDPDAHIEGKVGTLGRRLTVGPDPIAIRPAILGDGKQSYESKVLGVERRIGNEDIFSLDDSSLLTFKLSTAYGAPRLTDHLIGGDAVYGSN